MNTIPNPDDWQDVFTIIVVSLIVAVPSWLGIRNHKALQKVDRNISNGHTTLLRDDMDGIRDTLAHIRQDLHSVKSELGDIRHEIREERKDRLELDHRVEAYRRNKT